MNKTNASEYRKHKLDENTLFELCKCIYECEFGYEDENYQQLIEEYDDNRYWKSMVADINGGDNFVDYCSYIFDVLEEEGWYE